MRRGSACLARCFLSRALAPSLALALALAAPGGVASAAEPPAKVPSAGDPHIPFPPLSPRVIPPPAGGYSYLEPQVYPSLPWLILQLVPSPELVVGQVHRPVPGSTTGETNAETKASFGLRWQGTPLLWSWGTNRRVSRWRYFVVDPLARHSGSLELSGTVEYVWGHVDRAIVRPGVRAYFPLVQRGEYLSMSIGTSGYAYDEKARVAYDVGAYVLYGLFGVQMTIAPDNGPMTATGTFRIRYF